MIGGATTTSLGMGSDPYSTLTTKGLVESTVTVSPSTSPLVSPSPSALVSTSVSDRYFNLFVEV